MASSQQAKVGPELTASKLSCPGGIELDTGMGGANAIALN